MNRIDKAFKKDIASLRENDSLKEKAFIAFLTGGDPNIETTEKLIYTLEEAGADLIEIGIPFSDPIAEGVVIQDANERALKSGCNTDSLFELVRKVRERSEIPIVFLTYLNPIYTYGKEKFLENCKRVGVDGIIVPDLPYEEKEELLTECERNGVTLISLIAPTSKDRIKMIAKEAKGFIYLVSSLGVTGVRSNITTDVDSMIEEVRKVTTVPCAIGFGISTASQASEFAKKADGVIVGSRIVRIIETYGVDSIPKVYEYVKEMKDVVSKINYVQK
jgi:tryptophan synthase alpha chain